MKIGVKLEDENDLQKEEKDMRTWFLKCETDVLCLLWVRFVSNKKLLHMCVGLLFFMQCYVSLYDIMTKQLS